MVWVARISLRASASALKKEAKDAWFFLRKNVRPSSPVILEAWFMHPPPTEDDERFLKGKPEKFEMAKSIPLMEQKRNDLVDFSCQMVQQADTAIIE